MIRRHALQPDLCTTALNWIKQAYKVYEIISIQKSEPPFGTGSDWYHYEIVNGRNIINGYKQGSLNTVTTEVETNVAQLNERQLGKHTRTTQKYKPCNSPSSSMNV